MMNYLSERSGSGPVHNQSHVALAEEAMNNTKEQFAASPDLASEIMNAVMNALAAHTVMSNQPWSPRPCART